MINRKSYILVVILFLLFAGPQTYAAFPIKSELTTTEASQAANQQIATTGRTDFSKHSASVNRERANANANKSAAAGFGIAALICGIVGLFVLGIPLGILAIVFGVIGMNRRLKGMAIAGVILGIIDVIGALIFLSSMNS